MLELTQVQVERYLTSVSQCSTNQIVQNLTSRIEFDWWKKCSCLWCSRHSQHMHHQSHIVSRPLNWCHNMFLYLCPLSNSVQVFMLFCFCCINIVCWVSKGHWSWKYPHYLTRQLVSTYRSLVGLAFTYWPLYLHYDKQPCILNSF